MKNSILYAPAARRDLEKIRDYIAQELLNPDAAERTVSGILDAAAQLEELAFLGTPLSSVTGVESGYRFLVSGNYLVFYRIKGRDVLIDRVLYGRRNYLRVLFREFQGEREKPFDG